MKCTVVFLALTLASCLAFPEGDKAADDVQAQLKEVVANAQATITDFSANVQKQLANIDQKAVIDTVKNNTDNLVKNVQQYLDTVGKEVKTKAPEFDKAWNEATSRLTKFVEDFKKQVPQASESAAQLQEKFAEGVKTIVQETGKIADSVKENSGEFKEQVAKFTKQLVDNAVKATDDLNKQLQASVAPAKA